MLVLFGSGCLSHHVGVVLFVSGCLSHHVGVVWVRMLEPSYWCLGLDA